MRTKRNIVIEYLRSPEGQHGLQAFMIKLSARESRVKRAHDLITTMSQPEFEQMLNSVFSKKSASNLIAILFMVAEDYGYPCDDDVSKKLSKGFYYSAFSFNHLYFVTTPGQDKMNFIFDESRNLLFSR